MKTKLVIVSLAASGFLASTAFAQMQPIPNPPEKPAAAKHGKHHAKRKAHHHAKSATASKDASSQAAKPAMPLGPVNPKPPAK